MTLDARVGEPRGSRAGTFTIQLLQGFHGLLLRFQTVRNCCQNIGMPRRSWTGPLSRGCGPPSPKAVSAVQGIWRDPRWRDDFALAIEAARRRDRHRPHRPSACLRCRGGQVIREVCARSCGTRSTRFRPRRCGTPFGTPRHDGSRSRSVMATSTSECVCATTEEGSMPPFSLGKPVRGTLACRVCVSAPH